MQVCQSCISILCPSSSEVEEATLESPKSGWVWTTRYRGRTGHSLKAAAGANCILCTQVWESLDDQDKANCLDDDSLGLTCSVFWNLTSGECKTISLSLKSGEHSDTYFSRMYIYQSVPEIALRRLTDIQERNNTPQVMALCRKWLHECIREHRICQEHAGKIKDWLPTRLLDTGAPDQPASLRLCLSKDLDPTHIRYLALSHCWGKLQIPTLQLSNIETMQQVIPLNSLPLTFHHAAVTTRALGYRYLWIDSLCIIQDSPQDWEEESMFMGEVYSQAVCVLAATGSQDGRGGLFRRRNPIMLAPVELETIWPSPNNLCTYVRTNMWHNDIADGPLTRRGWVLQERVLSPRTLHFGGEQIFWECRERHACEMLPDRIPSALLTTGTTYHGSVKRWMRPGHFEDNAKYDTPNLFDYWILAVEAFMRTGLTRSQDKLVALSGLAKKVQVLLHDEYFAGLWGGKLMEGLTWYVDDGSQVDGSPSQRSMDFRSPSWSWAAIDGVVDHKIGFEHYRDAVKVHNVAVTPLGKDQTGQLKAGHINLEGVVKRIGKPAYCYVGALAICGHYYPDDRGISDKLDELYALPLRYYRVTSDDEEELLGLIITPVKSSGHTFERVGFFTVSADEDIALLGNVKPEGVPVSDKYGLSGADKARVLRLI